MVERRFPNPDSPSPSRPPKSAIDLRNITWLHNSPLKERGIITGSDSQSEWLLPIWWENYSSHADFPVLFVDFGLSRDARLWCEERGEVVDVHCYHMFPQAWFLKPFSLLTTPFNRSVWLDVDCVVQKPIDSLFDRPEKGFALAMAEGYAPNAFHQKAPSLPGECFYNSGVLAFQHGESIIPLWAKKSIDLAFQFRGDQEILCRIIHKLRIRIDLLPIEMNWRWWEGPNEEALVIHYTGTLGKEQLKKEQEAKKKVEAGVGA